jgi:prepilin-type N-terminal cleavage/methylation domain
MGRNFEKLKPIQGFTLIEFMAVLMIIGIFSGFLFPVGQQVVYKARLSKDAHNLRQIALSYFNLIQGSENARRDFSNIISMNDWAVRLANQGGINAPECYLSIFSDKSLEHKNIVDNQRRTLGNFKELPLDWVCISPIPLNAPLATTPILYSRGLNVSKGVWEEDSVYGTRGGFIAFLDGHAEFFSDLHHKLVNFRTLQPTSQIQEAVPSQAHAYGTSGRIW